MNLLDKSQESQISKYDLSKQDKYTNSIASKSFCAICYGFRVLTYSLASSFPVFEAGKNSSVFLSNTNFSKEVWHLTVYFHTQKVPK